MPMIGPLEIMLVGVVALLVFGPEKLPEMARTVGRTANQLRRMAADLKEEFNAELEDDDEDHPEPRPRAARSHTASADTEGAEVDPGNDPHDDLEPNDDLPDDVEPVGDPHDDLEPDGRLRDDLTARDSGHDSEGNGLEAGTNRRAAVPEAVPDRPTDTDE